jgi:hypothetical protein
VACIVAAVGYDINTTALKLTYQDFEGDGVVVSSTKELTYAIRQFFDKGMLKFVGSVQHETRIKPTSRYHAQHVATEAPNIPKDILDVDYHTTCFDPSRTASGLTVDDGNRRVTQTIGDLGHKSTYLTNNGITSGCKHWSFRIITRPGL